MIQKKKDEIRQYQKENVLFDVIKVMNHFFPLFFEWLKNLIEPRIEGKITYAKEVLIITRIMAFLTALGSLRNISYEFNKDEVIENIRNWTQCAGLEQMFHHDTLNNFLKKLPPEEIEKLRYKMIYHLIRQRYFEDYRIFNKYWLIAIDGTGIMCFNQRHCEHCLVKKIKGKTLYYHTVLEAKIVFGDIALSIDSEMIEEKKENAAKGDCELNAAYRLLKRLKDNFPRLPICLLADSLYACEPIFQTCENYRWKYIVNFKSGSIPTVADEFKRIKDIETQNKLNCKIEKKKKAKDQDFRWVNGITHQNTLVNVFECVETVTENDKAL